MIKPKNHLFRVKVMLNKLEAVNNKVASRCHASLRIDNEQLYFKATPELKKNVAVFNTEVQYDNYSLYFDQITGLYENKSATMVLEIETQGTKVKIGEVQINMGAILNEKKYRIVNQFPLSKCYDKTAKVKLSVDFIPISSSIDIAHITNDRKDKKQLKEHFTPDNITNSRELMQKHPSEKAPQSNSPSNHNFKQSNYKSRLAEQSNLILQQKIYEYEQKMDNYRLSQTQLQEKLHEQISNKDQQISTLTIEHNRKNQHIAQLNLEAEQIKFKLKEINEENISVKETNRLLQLAVQNLQAENDTLKKQYQSLQLSLDNQGKAKQNKEKHLTKQIAKYTTKYLQSEQQRNKVVFELQSKFKEEMEKKENYYRTLMANNDKKHNESTNAFKNKIKQLENIILQKDELIDRIQLQHKKTSELASLKHNELEQSNTRNEELKAENSRLAKSESFLSNELETIQFSYQQLERDLSKLKQQLQTNRKTAEQTKMELQMANQTIEEQRRALTKYSKELQVYQEREYYLTEKYNDQLEIKSINEQNIREETVFFKQSIYKLKNQLKISDERYEEESSKNSELLQSLQLLQLELANKNSLLMQTTEEKLILEGENYNANNKVNELEQNVLLLKAENHQLNEYLRDKKAAQENDKSIEWSYKIEELQKDIAQMLAKFKSEKEAMRDNFRKEDSKRKEQITNLQAVLKKSKDEYDTLRKTVSKKQLYVKELEKGLDELKAKHKQKNQQLQQIKERLRVSSLEKEELQKSIVYLKESNQSTLKDLQQKQKKELKVIQKAQAIKSTFVKIINHILEYISKPIQTVVTFNELSSVGNDMEITNIINLALRKHCEERTKAREYIKKLEIDTQITKEHSKKYQQQGYRHKEDRYFQPDQSPKKIVLEYDWKKLSPTLNTQIRDPYELQNLTEENSKLKREISQLKVKIKNIEQDVVRAQRKTDNERYTRETVKRQIEQLQDQLQKVSFQLKKKEKLVAEYENQMKELQEEVISLRNSHTGYKGSTPSRSESKTRDKEQNAIISRNQMSIRDLELKLNNKNKQNDELLNEINMQKGEILQLREAVANSKNESKVLQGRIKQRNAKIAIIQQQFNEKRVSLQQQLAHQANKLRKFQQRYSDLEAEKEADINRLQLKISLLQKQTQDVQRKSRSSREEARQTQTRLRKQNEAVLNNFRSRVNQLETTIVVLRSEVEQLTRTHKELTSKNTSLNATLTKKVEELEKIHLILAAKSNQISQLQDKFELYTGQSQTDLTLKEERIHQLEQLITNKEFELEEYRFKMEGRVMDLQNRLEDYSKGPSSRRK